MHTIHNHESREASEGSTKKPTRFLNALSFKSLLRGEVVYKKFTVHFLKTSLVLRKLAYLKAYN